jgi:uncharacterized caspase-like protein
MKATSEDRILIYFSGHGDTVNLGNGDMGFLIAYDTKEARDGISMQFVSQVLDGSQAKHRLYIADACHSGAAFRDENTDLRGRVKTPIETFASKRAGALMAAGTAHQLVAELQDGSNGVYTSSLIKGLKGAADRNKDTYITARELSIYLEDEVPKNDPRHETKRALPQYRSWGVGQFLFNAKPPAGAQ